MWDVQKGKKWKTFLWRFCERPELQKFLIYNAFFNLGLGALLILDGIKEFLPYLTVGDLMKARFLNSNEHQWVVIVPDCFSFGFELVLLFAVFQRRVNWLYVYLVYVLGRVGVLSYCGFMAAGMYLPDFHNVDRPTKYIMWWFVMMGMWSSYVTNGKWDWITWFNGARLRVFLIVIAIFNLMLGTLLIVDGLTGFLPFLTVGDMLEVVLFSSELPVFFFTAPHVVNFFFGLILLFGVINRRVKWLYVYLIHLVCRAGVLAYCGFMAGAYMVSLYQIDVVKALTSKYVFWCGVPMGYFVFQMLIIRSFLIKLVVSQSGDIRVIVPSAPTAGRWSGSEKGDSLSVGSPPPPATPMDAMNEVTDTFIVA